MEVDPFEGRYGGPSILPLEPALIALIFATCLIGMLICLSFFQKLREWRLGETGSDGLEIQAPKAPKEPTERKLLESLPGRRHALFAVAQRNAERDDCRELRTADVRCSCVLLEWWDQAATSRPSGGMPQ